MHCPRLHGIGVGQSSMEVQSLHESLNVARLPRYRIAGNFRGRKLSRIGDFRGENYRGLLVFAGAPKDATPSNFAEKTFANSHKTAKFAKVFSLESFPLYGIHAITIFHFSALVSSSKMPEKETQLSHMQLTKRK